MSSRLDGESLSEIEQVVTRIKFRCRKNKSILKGICEMRQRSFRIRRKRTNWLLTWSRLRFDCQNKVVQHKSWQVQSHRRFKYKVEEHWLWSAREEKEPIARDRRPDVCSVPLESYSRLAGHFCRLLVSLVAVFFGAVENIFFFFTDFCLHVVCSIDLTSDQ